MTSETANRPLVGATRIVSWGALDSSAVVDLVIDYREHVVADAEMEAGLAADQGTYQAICAQPYPDCPTPRTTARGRSHSASGATCATGGGGAGHAGCAVPERCECLRPLGPPQRAHWWPYRDPEPEVRVVVRYGDEPGFLRMVRVPGGWHAHGTAAMAYPEFIGPDPWPALGRCWTGRQHPVLDATGWPGAGPATHVDDTARRETAIAARHTHLFTDLGEVLDTDAGLNAIVADRGERP